MVIGIFAFDGPMYCDKNGIYCNTTVTNEMLDRYFVVVDKLYVIMRTVHIDETYESCHLKKVDLSENLKIVEMPNFNTPYNFFLRNRYLRVLEYYISKSDLIFLRIPSIISNMVARICKKIGKPYLVEVGGCAWDSYFNHGLTGKLVAPYMYFKEKSTVSGARFASYVTEKWLQYRYPTCGNSIVASNVYLNSFDENNINRRIIQYKDRIPQRYKLGTIASVDVRYKGQEYVIRALGILKRKGILLDYDLVGAGNPAYLKKLARKCEVMDQVHFLGVKLHEDIWDWLDSIDIYVQPSKQEGLPRSVIEALNRGCLAIGSNIAGIPELLESDMLFKSGDVEQICSVIQILLNEKDHTKRVIRNFEKSKEFDVKLLNERRDKIFKEYRQYVLGI